MSEDYWDGAIWVYHATITNDGVNSGNHVYDIVPGAGNEFELLYGQMFNGDAAARSIQVAVLSPDKTLELARVLPRSFSVTAGQFIPLPAIDEILSNGGTYSSRWIIARTCVLRLEMDSLAVSKNTRASVTCRIRGALPTVTLTSPTDAVEVVDINQVF